MRPCASTLDRLDALLDTFTVRARQFHTGSLCGLRRFDVLPGRGFLQILRLGTSPSWTGRSDPAGW